MKSIRALISLPVLLLILMAMAPAPIKFQHQDPGQTGNGVKKRYRIAIAGIAIESSVFSPALTAEDAFHAKYGGAAFSSYPFLASDSPLRARAEWIPTVLARALPGGVVTREAYESLLRKTLDSLRSNGPFDGIYLDIHGAMSVTGLDDPEGDYLQRIRAVVGMKPLISASMDLHGNVSSRLAENLDLITCYRKAPHEDALETKERAMRQLLERLEQHKGKPPYKAYVSVPVLLPGEKTSTRLEPAKSLYASVAPAAAQPGITDASIWIGYAWADEPRDHAVVMATGDDCNAVKKTAESLATALWNDRRGFSFVAPSGTLGECLQKALSGNRHPFFISDCGDNPTAGASGDVTWALHKLLARPEFAVADGPSLIYASIPGPDLVAKALAAKIGDSISALVGATVDARFAGPVKISGQLESVLKGDKEAEVEIVVRVGSLHIIVSRKRKAYRTEADFTRLGLKPRQAAIVLVKLGYLDPELYAMQGDWQLALTPGGADQNITGLPFKRIGRPMFPFDPDMATPDLSARWIPVSGKIADPL